MIEMILSIAFPLFLLMDPIGNIPIYLAVLKDTKPDRKKKIILRELLIALMIIIAFCFIGNYILSVLQVQQYTVMIAGGIILFLIALQMIFPLGANSNHYAKSLDPLVVPLAVPLVAGPAVLAAVMLYSHQTENKLVVVAGIVLAWIVTTAILISSTFLQRILKDRGIIALERLMGLILTLIAVQMFMHGITLYHHSILQGI